jgi:hypothetical protein
LVKKGGGAILFFSIWDNIIKKLAVTQMTMETEKEGESEDIFFV